MSRNLYHVSKTLILDPKLAPIEPGKEIFDLLPGQAGVFSTETHLSIDGTDAKDARDFYIEVGIGDCEGNIVESERSAGLKIQRSQVEEYDLRCYTPYQSEVWEITGLKAQCETAYSLKMIAHSADSFAIQGFKPNTKSFPAVTSCCEDCGCPSGNCIDLAVKLAKSMAVDADGCLAVYIFDESEATECGEDRLVPKPGATIVTTTETNVMDDAAVSALVDTLTDDEGKPTGCLGIRVYGIKSRLAAFCGIPFVRGTNIYNNSPKTPIFQIVPGENFGCMGNICRVRSGITAEIESDDLAIEKYWDGGWEGNGLMWYRQTAGGVTLNTGSVFGGHCDPNCCNKGYHTVDLTYYMHYQDGWEVSDNQPNNTRLVIPCDVGNEPAFAILGILDNILSPAGHSAGFGPLLDDAQGCPTCDTPNKTNEAFGNNPDVGDTDGDGKNDTPIGGEDGDGLS